METKQESQIDKVTIKLAKRSTYYSDHKQGDRIYVVGCSLSNRPFLKEGLINWMTLKDGGGNWLGYGAFSIFGDSGGALLNEDYELIGLVSRGPTLPNGQFITHMGLGVPLPSIQ